jgi:CrcB protein
MAQLFWVCIAGAAGTALRYLVGAGALRLFGGAFPYGTLAVNVIGCFLMSLVVELSLRTTWIAPGLRVTLTTGFMGGLTTYSAFNYESLRMFSDRAWGLGALYMIGTASGCIAAGMLGLASARRIAGVP